MKPLRSLAVAQTIPIRGDVDANLEQHLHLARAAAEEGARVLVFPELSLTGYELDLAPELAFSESDARLTPLASLASSRRITLVVGAPARIGPRLHIGAFVLSPEGTSQLYTKHHLGAFPADASPEGIVPPAEASVFHPGTRNPLVPLGGHTAAVAVCADTGRPSLPERAAERGAMIYLASLFVIPPDLEKESAALAAYAAQHSMAVAFANYGGPSGGLPSAGRSTLWSDRGERLARLDPAGPGLALATETDTGWRARTVAPGGL